MSKTTPQKSLAGQRHKQQQQANNLRRQSFPHAKGRVQHRSNRRSWLLVGGTILIIAIIISIFYYVSRQPTSSSLQPQSATERTPVSASVMQPVSQVEPAVLATVGTGGSQVHNTLQATNGQPLLAIDSRTMQINELHS